MCHYVKRVIFGILIEVGKESFMSYSALLRACSVCLFAVAFCAFFELKPIY